MMEFAQESNYFLKPFQIPETQDCIQFIPYTEVHN